MTENDFLAQRLAFYRDLYAGEFARRDQLNAGMGLQLALLSLLGGGVVYFVHNWPVLRPESAAAIFLLGLAATLFSLVKSAFHFRRALWGHNYRYILTPAEWEEYHEELAAHYAVHPDEKPGLESDFATELLAQVADCAAFNFATNSDRVGQRLRAYTWMLNCLVCLLITTIPYVVMVYQSGVLAKGAPGR